VIQEALVVGDDDGRVVGTAKLVDTFGNDSEGVDVESRVSLVENCETRREHGHL